MAMVGPVSLCDFSWTILSSEWVTMKFQICYCVLFSVIFSVSVVGRRPGPTTGANAAAVNQRTLRRVHGADEIDCSPSLPYEWIA